MAQVSKAWLEAQASIDAFREEFEKKYGFSLLIHIRNSRITNVPLVSLSDILEETNRHLYEMHPTGIIKCSYGNVRITNGIQTKTRVQQVTMMRQIFCYIAIEFGYAFTEIGRFLGMNHSTIIAAKKSITCSFETNYNNAVDKYESVKSSIIIKFSETDE